MKKLTKRVKLCSICKESLPLAPNPILQVHRNAKILIAGQAPGIRVHKSGVPFDDPSGKRLRQWLGVDEVEFYDSQKFSILPMGFCYPGTGKSGDLPPRKECAPAWRDEILTEMPNIELVLAIGAYAQKWHLGKQRKENLTATVKNWQAYWPEVLPLPHPSPRNNIWLKKNEWFKEELVPKLQERVNDILV